LLIKNILAKMKKDNLSNENPLKIKERSKSSNVIPLEILT